MWLPLALVALACIGQLTWQIAYDPETRFLSSHAPAEWVIEAIEPSSRARIVQAHEVSFRKTFALADLPPRATMRVRVHRTGSVWLNGVAIELGLDRDADWKRLHERDVATFLRAGENEIVVRALALAGPPAAWLVLEAADLRVSSDATWTASSDGAAARPVRLATTPMSAWGPSETVPTSLLAAVRDSAAWLLLFAFMSAIALFGARALPELRGRWLIAASALAIAALTWHNRALDPTLGFDSSGHLDYVLFVLTQHGLPLASDGWSMYHPPLYYAAAAAVVALFGEHFAVLRAFNALALLVQCAAILGSLRLLFPSEPQRVLGGFVMGAFVPMQIYLAQYVTNELWTAAFASTSVWLCLWIVVRDDRTLRVHLTLGVLLGAALLTKVSALIVASVTLAVLGARLLARVARDRGRGRGRAARRRWLELRPRGLALRDAARRQLGRGFGLPVVAGSRLPHGVGLSAFRRRARATHLCGVERLPRRALLDALG